MREMRCCSNPGRDDSHRVGVVEDLGVDRLDAPLLDGGLPQLLDDAIVAPGRSCMPQAVDTRASRSLPPFSLLVCAIN